ncbi:MAG TPA: VWA domain-containing protein [Spirochaetota bacterium]|nr:VWA domain-containing protein [Spirochaetota bacterium]HRZ27270.1 VWA domain-containing protein [Spirochaetota bacterium]HSA14780.1 VWA domain-containing protein [Spirochaetota bacterium]
MIKTIAGTILAVAAAGFIATAAFAAEPRTQVLIILDASGSMWGKAGDKSKIDAAKDTLISIVRDLADKPVLLGLRIYGHRNRKCTNTVLEVPVGPVDFQKIRSIVLPLRPMGKTPIAHSLLKAADDFRKDIGGEKIIIVITDGIETCSGDPCEIALKHQAAGVVTKVHVVGFGMNEKDLSTLACVVKPSGGILVSAQNQEDLHRALNGILAGSVRKNLIVTATDKSGQNVFIRVRVAREGKDMTESEGIDVGFYLEKGMYDLTVRNQATGIEAIMSGVAVDDEHLEKRQVSFSGSEIVLTGKDTSGHDILTLAVVHDASSGKIVAMMEKDTMHRIPLPPGTYDVEVQDVETRSKEWIRGIDVKDSVEKTLIFKRGRLVINTRNTRGAAIKTNVELSPQSGSMKKMTSPGKTRHEFILPEGVFDLTVRYWYSKAEQSLEGVGIADGQIVEKDVIIDTD